MGTSVDRRRFVKTTGAIGAGMALSCFEVTSVRAAEVGRGAPAAKKLGWTLCCGAYSFNRLTFSETLEKVRQLGLDCVEGFDWQPLSKEKPKVQTNSSMSAADRRETRKRLKDAGIRMGVCYIRELQQEDASRKTFEWAKDLGVETLVAEPPFKAYDMIEMLCDEYQINLAVHNHPAPSRYFDPATVAKICEGRGKRIGACCDTGHWVRSGFDPVEACKKLEGRIITFHLKDVDRFGDKKAECVPWGTGKGSIASILEEMHGQGFKGVFTIEYEPYRPENFEKVVQCVTFFDETARNLS